MSERRPRRVRDVLERALERALDEIPPASGAVVMGTGIVSIALLLDGRKLLSTVLLVLAAAIWLALVWLLPAAIWPALAWLLPARAIAAPEWLRRDLGQPAALTSIAGTCVLGTRLTLLGWEHFGEALLVVALAVWLALVPLVLRNWRTPTVGASFILTVATESLALLAATLALVTHHRWLVYAALVPFCLGLVFYLFVLSAFQFRALLEGLGDHWVTGGALAISALTCGRIALAAAATHALAGEHALLETLALVLWCLMIAWLPALLIAELVRPRLRYTVRRWSTVFPFGMYAACSFEVGAVTGTAGIGDFARVWVWVAVAVWALVFAAMLGKAPRLLAAPARRHLPGGDEGP
ncbi:MAG: tellurite resistance/C4-dicarboxylate transporter family protein [Acidobacteriota bacterium]|nr:tellurite resistance/C4-dicarboxylate transporter family protein [Acidobacteriota bacterium]